MTPGMDASGGGESCLAILKLLWLEALDELNRSARQWVTSLVRQNPSVAFAAKQRPGSPPGRCHIAKLSS